MELTRISDACSKSRIKLLVRNHFFGVGNHRELGNSWVLPASVSCPSSHLCRNFIQKIAVSLDQNTKKFKVTW